jgi:hypothetical protein
MLNDSLLNGVKTVTVQANKFNNVHGNTYHVTKVTVTGHSGAKVSKVSDVTYGYGDHYIVTANKLITGEHQSYTLRRDLADKGIELIEIDHGYGRKRDLFTF